jgi:DNA-binding NarL/FixJ family response regulator
MNENDASVMIVANPGPLLDGLRALIFAIPQIGFVTEASDLQTAFGTSNGPYLSLIVLDADLARGEVRRLVREIKTRWSRVRCIFLANDVRQQLEAETAGVDAALLKGVPPATITATVLRLLAQEGKKGQLAGMEGL